MSLSGIAWRLYRGASLLTDAGVSPSMSFIASKKLRLINICAILAGGSTFPYWFHFVNYNALLV